MPRSHPQAPLYYPQVDLDQDQASLGDASIDDLGDVNVPTPADGDVLTWDDAAGRWVAAVPPSPHRNTFNITTASLADDAAEDGTLDIETDATVTLFQLVVDAACKILLYASSAARTLDAGRPETEDPDAGTGVFLEYVCPSAGTYYVSPTQDLYNGDSPVDTIIYYTIVNQSGGTTAVSVDLIVET